MMDAFSNTQTMILGDCLTVLQTMPEASVKASVFSPPYNLKKKYSLYNDDIPDAAYLADMGNAAMELRRVTRPDGHVFLNMGWNTKHPWRSIDVLSCYRPYFELQNAVAWIKSLAIDGTALPAGDLKTLPALQGWVESVGLPTGGKEGAAIRRGLCEALRTDLHERTIGHMPSLNSDFFLNPGWEHVWHLTPTGRSPIDRQAIGVPYVWKDQPARFGHGRPVHCRGSAWQLPYDTVQSNAERSNHPSTYPIELVLTCLRLAKLAPGDLVLDPYAGTGTTLVAAKMLGLSAIGIEIDPAYCDAAEERLR
jgi:site-specific DNA-methyltransferase (adenine-specific)